MTPADPLATLIDQEARRLFTGHRFGHESIEALVRKALRAGVRMGVDAAAAAVNAEYVAAEGQRALLIQRQGPSFAVTLAEERSSTAWRIYEEVRALASRDTTEETGRE